MLEKTLTTILDLCNNTLLILVGFICIYLDRTLQNKVLSLISVNGNGSLIKLMNPLAQNQDFEETDSTRTIMRVYGIFLIGAELYNAVIEIISKIETKVIYEKAIQRASTLLLYLYCYLTNMDFFMIAISLSLQIFMASFNTAKILKDLNFSQKIINASYLAMLISGFASNICCFPMICLNTYSLEHYEETDSVLELLFKSQHKIEAYKFRFNFLNLNLFTLLWFNLFTFGCLAVVAYKAFIKKTVDQKFKAEHKLRLYNAVIRARNILLAPNETQDE